MSKKTVLLVEDDPDTRLIYSTMLMREGYEVIEAHDGRAGVELAEAHLPDVVIMNLVLPRADGISASALIRSNAATAHIPIIVCTAFLHAEGADMAEEAGCDVYLEKPCKPSHLVAEVNRLLGRVNVEVVAGG